MAQLAAFVLSPHTAQVDAAIAHHRSRLGFDTEGVLLEGFEHEQRVLEAAASYAGGTPGQYALTTSTTMGIATMYGGLTLRPGDDVLSTTHDFFSTEDSLRLLERRTGATVRRVRLYDDPATASVDAMATRLTRAITDRTRVVAVTWVHSSTGVRLPIPEIGAAIADLNSTRERPDQIVLLRRRRARLRGASTSTCPTSAATSSRPAPTSGCSARAAPASCGRATGDRSPRSSRPSPVRTAADG